MATIQFGEAPASRIEAGRLVLAAAESVDTTPIKARLAKFKQAHGAYAAAETAVRAAWGKRRVAEEKVGELDAEQDDAVDALAAALVGAGEPRLSPFKSLGFEAPGAIKALAPETAAKTVGRLVVAVRKRKNVAKEVLAAAAVADKAATAVLAAITAVARLAEAHATALAKREVLALPWEKTFAALKRGARAAEDDGATDLFALLFQQNAAGGKAPKGVAKRGEKLAQRQATAQAKQVALEGLAAADARVAAANEALKAARAELAAAKEAAKEARAAKKAVPKQAAAVLAAGGDDAGAGKRK